MEHMNQNFSKGIELVVSGIIENQNGKIFLAKSPKWNNKWTLPGGHIDPGEQLIKACAREIKEETGLMVKVKKLIEVGELINSKDFHRPAHFVYIDFHCTTESTVVHLDNTELTEFKWISPVAALELNLAESYDKTINKFITAKKLS